MSVREYIGARYVPVFEGEYDATKSYEPLTIVSLNGDTYTSKQFVPIGEAPAIGGTPYWAVTGNFNAQIEQYRQETANAVERVNTLENLYEDLGKKALIIIGDSYASRSSNGLYTATWPENLANAIGAELFNPSVPGCGWVHNQNGKTFLTQCNEVANTTNFSQDYEINIIIYGGYNDIAAGVSEDQVRTNITTGLNVLKTKYPTANIYVAGVNVAFQTIQNRIWRTFETAWEDACLTFNGNVTFIKSKGWLCSSNDCYLSDNLHPSNDKGNEVLFKKWLSILNGCEWKYTVYGTLSATQSYYDGFVNVRGNSWLPDMLLAAKVTCCEGEYRIVAPKTSASQLTNLNQNDVQGISQNFYIPFTISDIFTIDNMPAKKEYIEIYANTALTWKPFVNLTAGVIQMWVEFLQYDEFVEATPNQNSYASVIANWSLW